MKKFLSLVLALVMTMSLVTVSAGAKDFNDAEDIKYVEAVDVLSAIGVIDGNPDGSFNPQGSLTRAQAAKIICALNLTPKTAASLSADTAPFADVPASHWAAGYIAEGVSSGILAGVGNGMFAPDAPLTGYAYLKMLLVCLGYDAAAEDMTGANWSVSVAKLAKSAGLTKGNDEFVGTKAVTREEAALYALNALKAEVVYYPNGTGTDIVINGMTISTGGSAAVVDPEYDAYMDINYSRLDSDEDEEDNCGRPATVWTYKGEEIGTYAKTPILVYTAETDADDIADDLKAAGYKYIDGKTATKITDTTYEDLTANGKLVEFYGEEGKQIGDKDYNVVTAVVELETKATQIEKIIADKSRTDDEDESAIKLANGVVLTIDEDVTKGVEVDNFDELYKLEKNDWVLVTYAGKDVVAVEAAEVIEGKATRYNSEDVEVKIDGTSYGFSQHAKVVDSIKKDYYKFDGEFVLDSYGYIIAKGDGTETKSDVVLVTGTYTETVKYTTTHYAQVVNTAGETEEIVTDKNYKSLKGQLVTYTTNDDDEAELVVATYEDKDGELTEGVIAIDGLKIDDKSSYLKTSEGKKYYAEDVTMIYVDDEGEDLDVDIADEVEYVKAAAEGSYVVVNSDDEIEVIFIRDAAKTYASAEDIIYVANATIVAEDDDADTKSIKAYVDGEKITIDLDAKAKVSTGFFNYTVDEDDIYELEAIEDDVFTLDIDSIRRDKYVTLNEDKAEDPTEYVLDADAVVIDLSKNDMADLADIADMADELDEGETLVVKVLVDEDDEVITFMVIDIE